MATVGHLVIGMAAARAYHRRLPRWPIVASWAALAVAPDVDLLGYSVGVPYLAPWGHRGATHSIALAVAAGVAVGIAARLRNRDGGRLAMWTAAAMATHGLVDTLTNGGKGCALLWPFALTRFVAPWRPIPLAPYGLDLFSPHAAVVYLVEIVFFSPLLAYALWPRTPSSASRRAPASPQG